MQSPQLYVITGIMASGKSTVAQLLAERFDRSVHLHGDFFRRSIVAGQAPMSPDPSEEQLAQLRLRYRLSAAAADAYVAAGFVTVWQDTILGPMLDEAIAMIETRPLSLVVLCPSADEVVRREQQRPKRGYGAFDPSQLDRVLRDETTKVGLWVDSTSMTPSETADYIVAHLDVSLLIDRRDTEVPDGV